MVAPHQVNRGDGCEWIDQLYQIDGLGKRLRRRSNSRWREVGLPLHRNAWPALLHDDTVAVELGGTGVLMLPPTRAVTPFASLWYWNSDGSRAAMCGNAALCSARLAVYLEMVPPTAMCCLLTDAGAVAARELGRLRR